MATTAAPVTGISPSFDAATNTHALSAILVAYAASPDASTNYLTAVAGGYELRLDVGIYEIDASALLPIGPGLTIKGKGPLQTTIRFTEDGAPFTIAAYRDATSHHTGGGFEDLTLDGNGVAKTLIEVRFSDKVRLSNVALINSAAGTADEHAALALMGAQNGHYEHVFVASAGGTGTLLNYGASGNTFTNHHQTGCYEDLRLSGTHPALSTTAPPSTNQWINPIFERDNDAGTKPQSIYIGAGKHNLWDHPTLSLAQTGAGANIQRSVPIVKIERQLSSDGVTYLGNSLNTFREPVFSGSPDQYAADLTGSGGYGANHNKWTRAFDVTGVVALGLSQTRVFVQGGRIVLDGISEFWRDNTGAAGYVVPHVDGYIDWDETAGVAGTERVIGTGITADDLRAKSRNVSEVRAAKSDGTSVAYEARNNGNTVKYQVMDDGTTQVGGSTGPKSLYGTGAPASTPADGSTYKRTDSGSGQPNHYTRQNGAWQPTIRPPIVQLPAPAFATTTGATASTSTDGRTAVWKLADNATQHIATALDLEAWSAGYTILLRWLITVAGNAGESWNPDIRLERINIPAAVGSTSIYTTAISVTGVVVDQWQETVISSNYVPATAGPFNLRILRNGAADTYNAAVTGVVGIIGVVLKPN